MREKWVDGRLCCSACSLCLPPSGFDTMHVVQLLEMSYLGCLREGVGQVVCTIIVTTRKRFHPQISTATEEHL